MVGGSEQVLRVEQSAQGGTGFLPRNVEWIMHHDTQSNNRIYITAQPVAIAGPHRNIHLGITRRPTLLPISIGNVYVLLSDGRWQFEGQMLFITAGAPRFDEAMIPMMDNRMIPLDEYYLTEPGGGGKGLSSPTSSRDLLDGVLGAPYSPTIWGVLQSIHMLSAFTLEVTTYLLGAETIVDRYNYNRQYDNAIMWSGGAWNERTPRFITGQALHPQSRLRIGPFGNGLDHGCGPFAVYNALLHVNGAPFTPSGIIRGMEALGAFNLGGLGSNPVSVLYYLQLMGHPGARHHGSTNALTDNLDNLIRNSSASILLYRGGSRYIHYIMIEHSNSRPWNEQFWLYNVGETDPEPTPTHSVRTWLTNNLYNPWILITIP